MRHTLNKAPDQSHPVLTFPNSQKSSFGLRYPDFPNFAVSEFYP
jgi:hypothetical protein